MKAYQIAPLRKQHRISQADLSKRVDLHVGELGKIESGIIPVTDEYAEGILNTLNLMIQEKAKCQQQGSTSLPHASTAGSGSSA